MSALPPKADIAERRRHVRFVPKADICGAGIRAGTTLFDHLVGNRQHARWNCESERSSRAEVDCKLQFGGL